MYVINENSNDIFSYSVRNVSVSVSRFDYVIVYAPCVCSAFDMPYKSLRH